MKQCKQKVSVTLDADLLQKTRELARADDRSLSQYINLLLIKHIDQLEKKQSVESCLAGPSV